MTLQIQVITPEKIVIDTQADEIIIPTTTGEVAILPHHVPLVSQIAPGELIIKSGGKEDHLVVVGGFMEVSDKAVTILSDYAAHGRDVSAVKAQEAADRAKKAMESSKTEQDFVLAEAEFRRAIIELKVAGRYRKSS